MSDDQNFGFGKFVPGFDFLQNLAKGASQALPQMPNLAHWVAPTLDVEELDKRIGELKAVQFWLDQNGKALGATIQALEVQKMTLATLRGMNVHMNDLADALKVDPVAAAAAAAPAAEPKKKASAAPAPATGQTMVDPLQWWGSLTQQFQQIAAEALNDAARSGAADLARATATTARAPAGKAPASRKAARKTAARKRKAGGADA